MTAPRFESIPGAPRRVLGFDLGATTGWCVLDAREDGTVGVVASGVLSLPRGDHPGDRFEAAASGMSALVRMHHPLCIAVEHVARVQRSVQAAAVYHGLRAMLAYVAMSSDLAILEVGVGTIKKRATGSGGADKAAMVAAARVVLGREPQTHDEADAVFVALCGCDDAARWEAA